MIQWQLFDYALRVLNGLNGIDFLPQNYTFIPNLITIYFELIMTILILIEPFAKNRVQNYLEAEIEQIVKSLGVISSF